MELKAVLIVFFGVPVCVAILTAFPVLWVMGELHGPPLPRNDVIQGFVFAVFALMVLAIAVRAYLRVTATGASADGGSEYGWLAKGLPFFVLVGLGLGGWFGWKVSSDRTRHDEEARVELCRKPELWGLDQAGCLIQSRTCRKAAWSAPVPRNDPSLERLRTLLNAERIRIDQEQTAAIKAGAFYDSEVSRFNDRLYETLSSSFTRAGFDRATMVCLLDAKR